MLENPLHAIDFNEPEILMRANHLRELLIKKLFLSKSNYPQLMLTNHPHHCLFSINDFI